MTYDLWLLLGLFALVAAAYAAMPFSFVPGARRPGRRSCPCGDPRANHLGGVCYAGGKSLPQPARRQRHVNRGAVVRNCRRMLTVAPPFLAVAGGVLCTWFAQPGFLLLIVASLLTLLGFMGDPAKPTPTTMACGCPLGTHERRPHDRDRRPSPLPAPAPVPELPKAPPKLSPTFDPIRYLEPQDRAWLDGQLDLTRPLFPPPKTERKATDERA